MIAATGVPSGAVGAAAATSDPVARRYRALFAALDWAEVPDRDGQRRWPGPRPHPRAASIKALLVKRCEQKASVTDRRR